MTKPIINPLLVSVPPVRTPRVGLVSFGPSAPGLSGWRLERAASRPCLLPKLFLRIIYTGLGTDTFSRQLLRYARQPAAERTRLDPGHRNSMAYLFDSSAN